MKKVYLFKKQENLHYKISSYCFNNTKNRIRMRVPALLLFRNVPIPKIKNLTNK